jgi:hypothetical protein
VKRVTLSAVAVVAGLAQAGCELVVGEDNWTVGAASDGGDARSEDVGLTSADDAALEVAREAAPDGDAMVACVAAACLTNASACDAACTSDAQTCTSACGNDKGCAHQCQKTLGSCESACARTCSVCIGMAACGDVGPCPHGEGP